LKTKIKHILVVQSSMNPYTVYIISIYINIAVATAAETPNPHAPMVKAPAPLLEPALK
jgi:hypothetical protein